MSKILLALVVLVFAAALGRGDSAWAQEVQARAAPVVFDAYSVRAFDER